MSKLPYVEGCVFLVPLSGGGYARGVVARAGPLGGGIFGYFFGPRLQSPDHVALSDLSPAKAILRLRFSDLGLVSSDWPIVGVVPSWDRANWPMPDFVRRPPGMKPVRVRYSDADPMRVEAEYPAGDDSGLSPDRSSGQQAVEIKLESLLSGS